jgi:hypothetical protein
VYGTPIIKLLGDREIFVDERRAKIALQHVADIDQILLDQRLVQIVMRGEVFQRSPAAAGVLRQMARQAQAARQKMTASPRSREPGWWKAIA